MVTNNLIRAAIVGHAFRGPTVLRDLRGFASAGRGIHFAPEGAGGEGGGSGGAGNDDPPKTFTQEEVNSLLAKEKRKLLKDVGDRDNRIKTILEAAEAEDDETVLSLIEAAKKAKPKGKDGDDESKKAIEKAVQKVREEYAPKLERLSALEGEAKAAAILSAVTGKEGVDAYNPEDFVVRLQSKLGFDEKGKVVVLDEDGDPSDQTVAQAIAEIAKENPHLLRSKKLPGSGGGTQTTVGGGGQQTVDGLKGSAKIKAGLQAQAEKRR